MYHLCGVMIEQQKKEELLCIFSVMLLSSVEKKHSGTMRTGYLSWIPLLLKIYYQKNPDVLQIVATAIGICAEYGADYLKSHKKGIIDCLRTALEQPNAKNLDNIMAYEAAVSTCGKLNQFLLEDIYTYEFIRLWLSHLPIRCNLDEAKISHELLCSMMETSKQNVIGSNGFYLPNVIAIFAEVTIWQRKKLRGELSIY